jgi:signal transduction histidine kinase
VPKERLQEIIGKAEARAHDQLELIGDLLDLARVQEPVPETEIAPCDAIAILRDVIDMMQARIEDKALAVEVHVAPGLPRVAASEEHVKQIWINLISNAIKYTPDGGSVTISAELNEGRLRCAVRDTGIGIRPDEIERIFETFYRTEAAKALSVRGTGLGLSIVKGIVERYGGRIWVTSTVGEGSVFSFELPAASAAGAPPSEREAA